MFFGRWKKEKENRSPLLLCWSLTGAVSQIGSLRCWNRITLDITIKTIWEKGASWTGRTFLWNRSQRDGVGPEEWVLLQKIILGAICLKHERCRKHFHMFLTFGVVMGWCARLHMGLHPGESLALSMALAQLDSVNVKVLCFTAGET